MLIVSVVFVRLREPRLAKPTYGLVVLTGFAILIGTAKTSDNAFKMTEKDFRSPMEALINSLWERGLRAKWQNDKPLQPIFRSIPCDASDTDLRPRSISTRARIDWLS